MQYEKGKGEWVRDYLQENGEAYVTELHRKFSEWCAERDYDEPGYDSMRRTVWILTDLGLIVPTRTEASNRGAPMDRQYYRIASNADPDAPGWESPTREKYG